MRLLSASDTPVRRFERQERSATRDDCVLCAHDTRRPSNRRSLLKLVPFETIARWYARVSELGEGRYGNVALYHRREHAKHAADADDTPFDKFALNKTGEIHLLSAPDCRALVPHTDSARTTNDVVDESTTPFLVDDGPQALAAWPAIAVKRLTLSLDDASEFRHARHEIAMHALATVVQSVELGWNRACIAPLIAVAYERPNALLPVLYPVLGGTLESELENAMEKFSAHRRNQLHWRRWAEGDRILQWLHERCAMVHGDAHPGNWFIDASRDYRLLLGDFGEARAFSTIGTTRQFLMLAGHERLTYRFNLALQSTDKRQLGARLNAMESRIEASNPTALTRAAWLDEENVSAPPMPNTAGSLALTLTHTDVNARPRSLPRHFKLFDKSESTVAHSTRRVFDYVPAPRRQTPIDRLALSLDAIDI